MLEDRRWIQEIARLRARATKVRRRLSGSSEHDDALDAALETCEALLRELASARVDTETLRRRCDAEAATHAHLFEHLPIAAIETDASGSILTANDAASLLLNTSKKHLANRLLLHFAEDRAAFITLLSRLSSEQPERVHELRVRPRERAPLSVDARIITRAPRKPATWVWFLSPVLPKDEAVPRRDFHGTGIVARDAATRGPARQH